MTRKELLDKATETVVNDREDQYGSPEDNFGLIAAFWRCYLDTNAITSKDVAAMMILLKIARISSGTQHMDNWVDIAGYAACGGELEGDTE